MQIAIDAHQIGNRSTGAETYVRNLVQHLAQLDPDGDQYLVYLEKGQSPAGLSGNSSFETCTLPVSNTPVRFGLYYPYARYQRRFDLFHAQFFIPPFLGSRSVLTVHDLSFERFPEFFKARLRTQMKLLLPWSCHRARHVITVSESSKRDLVEFYRLDPRRITVTYEGAGEIYKPLDSAGARLRLQETYGIASPFILYVGNLEPRKNLARLLHAFAYLKRRDRLAQKLVIVGRKAWLYEEIFQSILTNSLTSEIVMTGYVPTEDLPDFYNAADLMVYPSLFEGFGLPVVEAMACGTPVVTSLGSSLEEIATGAALLVDPYSVASIAEAIDRIANGTDLQHALREAGLARAERFSFRTMAEQTQAVYHQLG